MLLALRAAGVLLLALLFARPYRNSAAADGTDREIVFLIDRSASMGASGAKATPFAKAQRAHEEGVIAKRAAGFYYSGKRTREWLKFKAVYEQEVVIVGYTEPRRSRKYFGALALAVRDKAKKRWVYAGHVGTGFTAAGLKSLYEEMQPLRTDRKPFAEKVKHENETTWLFPKLVGEVKFTEWTREGEMRHPTFLGLRTDKRALDVIREQV